MGYTPLNAGDLEKRVTLQSRTETDDDGGGQTYAYSDVSTVWASVAPGSGREFMAAQQLQPQLSHIVTIRYTSAISVKYRFKYVANGVTRHLPIHAIIDPLERHEQLVCYCSEEPAT